MSVSSGLVGLHWAQDLATSNRSRNAGSARLLPAQASPNGATGSPLESFCKATAVLGRSGSHLTREIWARACSRTRRVCSPPRLRALCRPARTFSASHPAIARVPDPAPPARRWRVGQAAMQDRMGHEHAVGEPGHRQQADRGGDSQNRNRGAAPGHEDHSTAARGSLVPSMTRKRLFELVTVCLGLLVVGPARAATWKTNVNYGATTPWTSTSRTGSPHHPRSWSACIIAAGTRGTPTAGSRATPTRTSSSSSPRNRRQLFRRGAGRPASAPTSSRWWSTWSRMNNADPKKVFAAGPSSGACMTQALLASYPDVFAGGSSLAGVPAGAWTGGGAYGWSAPASTTAQQWGDKVRNAYPGSRAAGLAFSSGREWATPISRTARRIRRRSRSGRTSSL